MISLVKRYITVVVYTIGIITGDEVNTISLASNIMVSMSRVLALEQASSRGCYKVSTERPYFKRIGQYLLYQVMIGILISSSPHLLISSSPHLLISSSAWLYGTVSVLVAAGVPREM